MQEQKSSVIPKGARTVKTTASVQ